MATINIPGSLCDKLNDEIYDLIIVGAGVSGVYTAFSIICAWYENYKRCPCVSLPPKILIVDASPRVAGRIASLPLPAPDADRTKFEAEFCAMRYYNILQAKVQKLVKKLSTLVVLETTEVPPPVVVTQTFPAIDVDLRIAFDPSNVGKNVQVDLSTALTLSENYENLNLLARSTGYTYIEDGMNLLSYYSDPPLSGYPEVRFVKGFKSLITAMLKYIQIIYNSVFDQLVTLTSNCLPDANGADVSADQFHRKLFTVRLNYDVATVKVCRGEEDLSMTLKKLSEVKKCPKQRDDSGKNVLSKIWDFVTFNNGSASSSSSVEIGNIKGQEETVETSNSDYNYFLLMTRENCECHSHDYVTGRQVVYTGTLKQFQALEIDLQLQNVFERRLLASNLFQPHSAVKIYVEFQKPWWNSDMIKFCSHPLLNQMIYYSEKVVLFYVLGRQAETLLNLFQIGNTGRLIENEWVSTSSNPTLINYLKSQINVIISSAVITPQPIPTSEQLNSSIKMLFHYAPQALCTPLPSKDPQIFDRYDFIRAGDRKDGEGFWYLSGDVGDIGGGWVENCLSLVDAYYPRILSSLTGDK